MSEEKKLEKYDAWLHYVRRELDDAQREAADPNTKWVSEEELWESIEAKLYELENCYAA